MPYPFGTPRFEAKITRQKISKVHSTVQRDAMESLLAFAEEAHERVDEIEKDREEEARIDEEERRREME